MACSGPLPGRVAALLVLACLHAPSFSLAAGGLPSAQLFDKVDAPEKLDASYRAHLCALLPQPCDAGGLALFEQRPSAEGRNKSFMLTAEKPLVMARVQLDAAGQWQLAQLHDFSAYRHSMIVAGSQARARLSLAPALYPLAPDRWAAAVLFTLAESYSGGGAAFITADFVALDTSAGSQTGVAATAAQPGIPFACSKMVRACFSEKEYRTSPHCHDENDGTLRIGYGLPAKGGEAYRWTFSWSETEWLANRPQRTTKTTRVRFANAEDAVDKVPFCGGPAS